MKLCKRKKAASMTTTMNAMWKKGYDSNQIKRCMAFKTTTNKHSRRQFQFVPIHKWRNMNIQRYGIIVAHMHMALWRSLCTNIHTFATLCFSLYLTARFSLHFYRSLSSFILFLATLLSKSFNSRKEFSKRLTAKYT